MYYSNKLDLPDIYNPAKTIIIIAIIEPTEANVQKHPAKTSSNAPYKIIKINKATKAIIAIVIIETVLPFY